MCPGKQGQHAHSRKLKSARNCHLLVISPILVEAVHKAAPCIETPGNAPDLALPGLARNVPHQELRRGCKHQCSFGYICDHCLDMLHRTRACRLKAEQDAVLPDACSSLY